MKVHFLIDAGLCSIPGGHQVRLEKTAAALRHLKGTRVSVGYADEPLPNATDVVHWFGARAIDTRPVRRARIPIAYSTIYCPRSYRHSTHTACPFARTRRDIRLFLSLAARLSTGQLLQTCRDLSERELALAQALEAIDVLPPNGPGEAEDLKRDFPLTTPMYLVPNAVNAEAFLTRSTNEDRSVDVLYVARFEPHKNQLGLVRALHKTGLGLVLAGPDHPHHPTYRVRCRRAAHGLTVDFLPAIPDDELPDLYAKSKVHALPSWYATAGLSSFEAAAAGSQVVTMSRGHADDYLGRLPFLAACATRVRTSRLDRPAARVFARPPAQRSTSRG
jgi:glycosyltransferase involved in cell wall biosynthesis